jgi:uncharacterized protein YbaA (DUF1428 family)
MGARCAQEDAMAYVDGFVIAVPKARLDDYKALAEKAGRVWKQHGALEVVECVADDVPYGELTSFPRAVQAGDDETVVFSWILYPDRTTRDACNAKVMADPLFQGDPADVPFDGKRMIYGGFRMMLRT